MTPQQARAQSHLDRVHVVGGQCPQCRRLMPLTDRLPGALDNSGDSVAPQADNYSGDRLVVSKYSYALSDPERWDVAVFKYPGDSQENYIKRIVGLPGEELEVFQGDLYTRPLGSGDPYRIERKPPEVVMAMRQFVHDTAHESAKLHGAGWPLAWSGELGWEADIDKLLATPAPGAETLRLRYAGEAPAGETRWLRYHHTPAPEGLWDGILTDPKTKVPQAPTPELITDFTPYNTRLNLDQAASNGGLSLRPRLGMAPDLGRVGLHWVGDLMLEADVNLQSEAGSVSLELVEAGDHFGVTLDAATGDATLWRQPFESDDRQTLATTKTPLRGSGSYSVRFANVDNRLLLWIDGTLIEANATYDDQPGDLATRPQTSEADEGDLSPAGIGVSGGKLLVERLRLWRDGYYFATDHTQPSLDGFATDMPPGSFGEAGLRQWRESLLTIASDPRLWGAYANRRRVDFPIESEQLFVMGDNSGFSLDARLWAGGNGGKGGRPGGAYLERKQLVGKAVCVYWPHSWYSVPLTRKLVPAWPNFEDMRLVR